MIDDLIERFAPLLPAVVAEVEVSPTVFSMGGGDWSFAAACPWRLTRDGRLLSGSDDPRTAADLEALVGVELRGVARRPSWVGADDPVLELAGGARIELFCESDLDPWVAGLPGLIHVGRASDGAGTGRPGSAAPITAAFAEHLPASIAAAGFAARGSLTLAGDGWSVSTDGPWRLMRGGELVAAHGERVAAEAVAALVGQELLAVPLRPGLGGADDPVLTLSDGYAIELFADTDDEPWTAEIRGRRFAGRASREGA